MTTFIDLPINGEHLSQIPILKKTKLMYVNTYSTSTLMSRDPSEKSTETRVVQHSWHAIIIKTHSSVSCNTRSRHTTPVSILTQCTIPRICNFALLVQNWTIFAVEMPSTVSTSHSKFQLNHTRCFQDINFQKLA